MFSIYKKYKVKIIEYIKFNAVGMSNFIISQLIYISLYSLFKLQYLVAYSITSLISVTASYFLNSKFTFKEPNYSIKKFLLSILVYVFEFLLNIGVIIFFVNILGISKLIAPSLAPIISTPPVFFLMRFVIKKI